jgi:signal transduction histidine kinase
MADQPRFLLIASNENSSWHDAIDSALAPLGALERGEMDLLVEAFGFGYDLTLLDAQAFGAFILQIDALQGKLARAEQLLKLKDDLIWVTLVGGLWLHAIRTHAITIRDNARIILEDPGATASGRWKEHVEKIERLAEIIISYQITPPPQIDDGVPVLSIRDFLTSRYDDWKTDPDYTDVDFELLLLPDDALRARIMGQPLREACDQVVGNAVKAMADLPKRVLTIGAKRVGNNVEITFCDTGPGIAVELREKVLIALTPKKGVENGLGFGLPMARNIIEHFDGELKIGSTGAEGTTMIIRLPLES